MAIQSHPLNKDWRIEFDPDDPATTFALCRTGFFSVRFNPSKWGQPVLYEVADEMTGFAGSVIPIIKKEEGVWYVLATRNDRPANDYVEKLLEGARTSVSNQDPFLTSAGLPITYFEGHTYSNSARISGKIRTGIAEATGRDFAPPLGAEWITWEQMAQTTDMMTKAVLFQFMILGGHW
jgi:hypothetical protein